MSDNFTTESRKEWHSPDRAPTDAQLTLGCLQRIANATELMARRYSELLAERDRYQRWYEQEHESAKRMARRITSLKGAVTLAKRRAAKGVA